MDETTAVTGHQDVRVLRVKLRSGKDWAMPEWVAKHIIEALAQEQPVIFGRYLQGALMGEMPAQPGRKRAEA